MEIKAIEEYYDQYVDRQVRAGVNNRHRTIRDLAVRHGMKDGMTVLEVGCGIGTLTGLLLKVIPHGKLTATDLSPASVESARKALGNNNNLVLVAGDSTVAAPLGPFDMIILPDVLEHIPLERQPSLFDQLMLQLRPHGKILIHSPDPFYLQWVHENRPELLQVIDIPLHLPALVDRIDQAGFTLLHFQRHSIWQNPPDYMALVLTCKPSSTFKTLPQPAMTLFQRMCNKAKLLLNRE